MPRSAYLGATDDVARESLELSRKMHRLGLLSTLFAGTSLFLMLRGRKK
jgi:hypothetical protein